jgi:two-component system KDP operon response regulator KdpE
MKVLIVDDEPDVRALVGAALTYADAGTVVVEAADADQAVARWRGEQPDIVVLDLMLGEPDGFWVLQVLRRESVVPVIVLTARGLEGDKIRGLELGADDYMVKPFSPGELVARIHAVLRRSVLSAARPETIEQGDVRIDLAARQVFRGTEEVRLTPTEFNLLVELASHAGEVVPHTTLLAKVWGPEYRTESHYLKVYVGRLREKLERDATAPHLIETVRGLGYRFSRGGSA